MRPVALGLAVLASTAWANVPPEALSNFAPLPKNYFQEKGPAAEAKVKLGRMLFHDARLSKNHDVSCNSCHDLAGYGVDGKRFSVGHRKQLGGRNAPTVYNAGNHIAQFWDGRAANLEEQAKGPVTNPVEMAMPDAERVAATLRSIPEYVKLFQKAFPGEKEPVTLDNAARAIAAFERGLVTPSRFDRFLAGKRSALTEKEQAGLKKFVELGCVTCHNGSAVGGTSFQKLGLVEPYPHQADLGRYGVTKAEEDKMKFRVPSLRNIEKTGPYFHDGSLEKLEDVVRTMAKHQLGKTVTDEEVASIVAFLKSLTGEIPKAYIAKPKLPASTPNTPKPDPS